MCKLIAGQDVATVTSLSLQRLRFNLRQDHQFLVGRQGHHSFSKFKLQLSFHQYSVFIFHHHCASLIHYEFIKYTHLCEDKIKGIYFLQRNVQDLLNISYSYMTRSARMYVQNGQALSGILGIPQALNLAKILYTAG